MWGDHQSQAESFSGDHKCLMKCAGNQWNIVVLSQSRPKWRTDWMLWPPPAAMLLLACLKENLPRAPMLKEQSPWEAQEITTASRDCLCCPLFNCRATTIRLQFLKFQCLQTTASWEHGTALLTTPPSPPAPSPAGQRSSEWIHKARLKSHQRVRNSSLAASRVFFFFRSASRCTMRTRRDSALSPSARPLPRCHRELALAEMEVLLFDSALGVYW